MLAHYPDGSYLNLGMAGVWRGAGVLLLLDAVCGSAALWLWMRSSLATAAAVTCLAGLALAVSLGTTPALGAVIAPDLPERPRLPGSTQ